MREALFKSLDSYWQTVVDELVQSLKDANRYASGNTAQAIGDGNAQPVVTTVKGFKVTIAMPDYYEFMDEGVSGAKYNKGISRFAYKDKMPPISAIRKFMAKRGIDPAKKKNTKAGKKRSDEEIRDGVAFAIARSIYEKGIQPTHFYSNVINDKKILAMEQMLLSKYSNYILDIIKVE